MDPLLLSFLNFELQYFPFFIWQMIVYQELNFEFILQYFQDSRIKIRRFPKSATGQLGFNYIVNFRNPI